MSLLTLRILKVTPWLDKHSGHDSRSPPTWLEAGQAVTAEVTIAWDDENMRAELLVEQLTEGQKALHDTSMGRWSHRLGL